MFGVPAIMPDALPQRLSVHLALARKDLASLADARGRALLARNKRSLLARTKNNAPLHHTRCHKSAACALRNIRILCRFTQSARGTRAKALLPK
jgi:hypothetical protein